MLLSIAESDCEHKRIRYAIFKISGMTPTSARRIYGFECMSSHCKEVERALSKIQQIHKVISDLQDKAVLQSLGLEDVTSCSSSESKEEGLILKQSLGNTSVEKAVLESTEDLETLLHHSDLKWFEFIERLSGQLRKDISRMSAYLFAAVLSLKTWMSKKCASSSSPTSLTVQLRVTCTTKIGQRGLLMGRW